MGIDAKKIQVSVLTITKFSLKIFSKFVQKHPLISSVLVFSYILYLFLPRAFFFLLYSSPFLACTYIFIKFYRYSKNPKPEKPEVKDEKKDSAAGSGKLRRKDGKSVRRTYTSHRNVEARNFEIPKFKNPENDSVRIIEQEKKELPEERKDSTSVSRNISEGNIGKLEDQIVRYDGGGKTENESLSSEEEEGKEGRIKAMEWTEDDQKNLMDLGLSELERNKRLESLIARRRARKLYKMQTEKYLMGNVNACGSILVAPVSTARSHTFDTASAPYEQIPGSAPSILLQNQNPFDIPYDPLEEKPNLMADSFQQEFMEAQQREMMFCRHESFSLGPSFPLQGKGDIDWLVGRSQVQEGDNHCRTLSVTDLVTKQDEPSNDVQIKPEEQQETENTMECILTRTQGLKHNNSESCLSKDNELAFRMKKTNNLTNIRPPVYKFSDSGTSPNQNSAPCPLPKARNFSDMSYIASPSTIDQSSLENHLLYTNSGPWHAPSESIGSDMQVEVSEVGSPPLTGNGSASSNDGDSLTYDGDIDKEITSGCDEMWGLLPHAPKEGHDQTITGNGFNGESISGEFPGFPNEPEDPTLSSSGILLPQQDQTVSISSHYKISSDGEQVVKKLEDIVQKPQEPMNSSEKLADEVNINYSDVPVHTNDDPGDQKSTEVIPESSNVSEVPRDLLNQADEMKSESINHIENKPLNSPEQSREEVNIAYRTDDPAVDSNDGKTDEKSKPYSPIDIPHEDGNVDNVIKREVSFNLSNKADKEASECYQNNEKDKGKSSDTEAIADQKSVEVTSTVPETSIVSELACDLMELADEINSESSNHIENIPKQSAKEVNIACCTENPVVDLNDGKNDEESEIDSPAEITKEASNLENVTEREVSSNWSNKVKEEASELSQTRERDFNISTDTETTADREMPTTEDRNSVEVTASVPETSIVSDEINSESSNYIENASEQSVEEVNIACSTDNPDSVTEQEVVDSNDVEIEEKSSNTDNVNKQELEASEDCKEEQSIRELEVSIVNQNSDDPSTSDIQQESTVDTQDSSVSSSPSSPKPILPEQVQLPPTSLDLNHTDVSESNIQENTLTDKSSDQQSPENSSLTQNDQDRNFEIREARNAEGEIKTLAETDHTTVKEETLQQSSEAIELPKSTENQENSMESIKDTESESRNLYQDEIDIRSFHPTDSTEISSRLIECIEGTFGIPGEYEPKNFQPEQELANLENPEVSAQGEISGVKDAKDSEMSLQRRDQVEMMDSIGELNVLQDSTEVNNGSDDDMNFNNQGQDQSPKSIKDTEYDATNLTEDWIEVETSK